VVPLAFLDVDIITGPRRVEMSRSNTMEMGRSMEIAAAGMVFQGF